MTPLYPRILLILAAAATLTPIFGGYLVGGLLMLWLPVARRALPAEARAKAGANLMRQLVKPVHVGVLVLVLTHLVAAVLGSLMSPYAQAPYDVFRVAVRMTIKWGLLWVVLSESMIMMLRLGWRSREIGLWLAGFMTVTLFYSLAQRYTGIDWTHGIGAQLGQHRFAYGVYRISAFMGHPLTLAYNLMLMILAAGCLAGPLRQSSDTSERRAWIWVVAAASFILLISGSRFVLMVIPAVVALGAGVHLLRYWKWILGLTALLATILWWEGSVVGRFGELFDQNVALTERFTRLIFWQVHWQMFLDHPLAGVTLAGVGQAMEAYYSAIGRRDMINTAHNVFLQALADSGVIGFVGVVALLTGLAVSARRARLLLGRSSGASLLLIATVLSGLMQNNLRDSEYLFALWFFFALLLVRVADLASVSPGLHDDQRSPERKPPQDLEPATGR